jgi:uncharacterized membrane protein
MASAGRPSWSGGPQKQQQQLQHQHHITLPQYQLLQHQEQLAAAAANGTPQDDWREQQHLTMHDHALAAADAESASTGKSSGAGKSKSNQSSVWAMAYYKHKTSSHGSGLPVAPLQLLAAAAPSLPWSSSSSSSAPAYGGSSITAGISSTAAASGKDSIGSSSSSWDSQAKEKPSRPAAARVARLLQEPSWHRGCWRQLTAKWSAALSSPKAAPAMVLTAAFIYSITASLDKVGIAAAQYSLSAYFLAQRVLTGIVGLVYLLTCARGALQHVVRDSLLLFSISLVEQGSVVVYLLAIENILVSYVVAIKRVNVLLSTLIGCILFKVSIRSVKQNFTLQSARSSLVVVGWAAYALQTLHGALQALVIWVLPLSETSSTAASLHSACTRNVFKAHTKPDITVNATNPCCTLCCCCSALCCVFVLQLLQEQVGRRIPYILLMLCGMLLIVLQPGHEDLHHSHHTRLHHML